MSQNPESVPGVIFFKKCCMKTGSQVLSLICEGTLLWKQQISGYKTESGQCFFSRFSGQMREKILA